MAHPSGRMRHLSVAGSELVATKNSGVSTPKAEPAERQHDQARQRLAAGHIDRTHAVLRGTSLPQSPFPGTASPSTQPFLGLHAQSHAGGDAADWKALQQGREKALGRSLQSHAHGSATKDILQLPSFAESELC